MRHDDLIGEKPAHDLIEKEADNVAKAAARQPEMFSKLQTLMFTGVAFIEGTFFVLFALSYIV